jgi:hypothetical protein
LIAPRLARADGQRLPCCLTSGRAENLRSYQGSGFQVVSEKLALVPDGPPPGACDGHRPGCGTAGGRHSQALDPAETPPAPSVHRTPQMIMPRLIGSAPQRPLLEPPARPSPSATWARMRWVRPLCRQRRQFCGSGSARGRRRRDPLAARAHVGMGFVPRCQLFHLSVRTHRVPSGQGSSLPADSARSSVTSKQVSPISTGADPDSSRIPERCALP